MKRELIFRAFDPWEKEMLYNVVIVDGQALRRGSFATDFASAFSSRAIPMQFVGLRDADKIDIYESDLLLCEGGKTWMNGDGRLPKGFPRSINGILEVKFFHGAFEFEWLHATAEHRRFEDELEYRSCNYLRGPLGKGSKLFSGEVGDDQTCYHVNIIGNIYQDPELKQTQSFITALPE